MHFYQHGWSSGGIANKDYMEENRKHGIITVYPQGMDDYYDGDFEKSWNVPYKPLDPTICKPDTQPMCYDSCQKLGLCF